MRRVRFQCIFFCSGAIKLSYCYSSTISHLLALCQYTHTGVGNLFSTDEVLGLFPGYLMTSQVRWLSINCMSSSLQKCADLLQYSPCCFLWPLCLHLERLHSKILVLVKLTQKIFCKCYTNLLDIKVLISHFLTFFLVNQYKSTSLWSPYRESLLLQCNFI